MQFQGRRPFVLAVVAAALASTPAWAAAADPAKDVRVINGPEQSVPVTGTVALAPGAQVDVANTSASPLHIAPSEGQRQVFMKRVHMRWFADGSDHVTEDVDVPLGKRLVIEHVSANFSTLQANVFDIYVLVKVGGQSGSVWFRTSAAGHIVNFFNQFSQPVRMYHDPVFGNDLRIGGWRMGEDAGGSGDVTIIGYLVDLP